MARVGIALGSNVGDRQANLSVARDRLFELHEGSEGAFLVSSIYQTAPVDCEPGTAAFFNAVIELESNLAPFDLLDSGQAIERELGRPEQRPVNAPRSIDVDLLYVGDELLTTDRLTLPHPRMRERRFVLVPLLEIRSDLVIPGASQKISDLMESFTGDEPQPVRVSHEW